MPSTAEAISTAPAAIASTATRGIASVREGSDQYSLLQFDEGLGMREIVDKFDWISSSYPLR